MTNDKLISHLLKENEKQKAMIAKLNATIDRLSETITRLNERIALLNEASENQTELIESLKKTLTI